jgi:peptidoglycan L-alanyl-D-glutamate endopeptidase CwlK
MIDSKRIDDLRPDVVANCRLFIKLMAAEGYKVAFSSTLRDDEKQAELYAQGRTKPGKIVTNSRVTTFHGKGLAFDIYRDAPTFAEQWQDYKFWQTARRIQTMLGFSKITGEESHSEWSNKKRFTGGQVRAGVTVPQMPLYQEEENVTIENITVTMNGIATTVPAILHEGHYYAQIRSLAEAQKDDKLTVDWDDKAKRVIINSR